MTYFVEIGRLKCDHIKRLITFTSDYNRGAFTEYVKMDLQETVEFKSENYERNELSVQ